MAIELANPSDQRRGPNCGVTACAVVSGASFTLTWNLFKVVAPQRYGKRWKGGTFEGDYKRVLAQLNIGSAEYMPKGSRGLTLQRWMDQHTQPDTVYIVVTTGHAQAVCNGTVIDQSGPKPVAEHWGRRKKVRFALHIYNPFAAARTFAPSPLPAPAQPAATSLFPALFPTQAPAAAELQLSLF